MVFGGRQNEEEAPAKSEQEDAEGLPSPQATNQTPDEAYQGHDSPLVDSEQDLLVSNETLSPLRREAKKKPRRSSTPLTVTLERRPVALTVLIDGKPYDPSAAELASFLGNDGNQYFCQVCKEFGDVVCCDGCPRVYHKDCLSENDPSRKSLENDDDPWYCPRCITKGPAKISQDDSKPPAASTENDKTIPVEKPEKRRADRRSDRASGNKCVDCQEDCPDLSLEPCKECGNYVHDPHCSGEESARKGVFCSTCRAVDELSQDEGDSEGEEAEAEPSMDVDDEEADAEDEPSPSETSRQKRPRGASVSSEKRKKRKKKHRKVLQSRRDAPVMSAGVAEEFAMIQSRKNAGLVDPIPAFFFYLEENRWKIERILSRKHRYFSRLSKGSERNELVAKEAALWWMKLRPVDHKRYMTMSMRDFESRVVEWKEEKNIQEMYTAPVGSNGGDVVADGELVDTAIEDKRLTYEKHNRLYLSTTVGCKPFAPEPDQSYNRVLLDLLHDIRFHPLHLIGYDQLVENEPTSNENQSKVSVPHYDVHGPVSTCSGDECIGCLRGWAHHCSVLKRRLPAIEFRAKLQPPMSSLMASRIGLGLKPPAERYKSSPPWNHAVGKDEFATRESNDSWERRNLPVLPCSTLTEVSARTDDITDFIESSMMMKVMEPPRPRQPDVGKRASGMPLPRRATTDSTGDHDRLNKCGRCRTIIQTDTGCVPCRRAQLVINMSKRQPSESTKDSGLLKVHTNMLGRLQLKEGSDDQSESDKAVAFGMLHEQWNPCEVLPHELPQVPSRKLPPVTEQLVCAEDDEDAAEEAVDGSVSIVKSDKESALDPGQSTDKPRSSISSERNSAEMTRETRSTRSAPSNDPDDAGMRPSLDEHTWHSCLLVACGEILLAMMRRDPLRLFAEPVTIDGYTDVVKRPIDFGTIRMRLLETQYKSVDDFHQEASLLCENALLYNNAGSIYSRTAQELKEVLSDAITRGKQWLSEVERRIAESAGKNGINGPATNENNTMPPPIDSKGEHIRAQIMEDESRVRKLLASDFMRTKENEEAYYGCLAIRRAAAAAEVSLASYLDSAGSHNVAVLRSHEEDEGLRAMIDEKAASFADRPMLLREVSSFREETVLRFIRKVQARRLEKMTVSEHGCARCDAVSIDNETKLLMNAESIQQGRFRKRGELDINRTDDSRASVATGQGSANTQAKADEQRSRGANDDFDALKDVRVSVRGSDIHGWGLFADQPFKKGEVAAEYIGELIPSELGDIREQHYHDHRIQDYQFRIDDKWIIDATMKGGHARYINHNCEPNCATVITDADPTNAKGRRVMIVAIRNIEINEELTYDYQFPLEKDLSKRVPCNCQSESCRGFMNWDLPEKGSNNRALLVHKRGANMRDRIRRLERPRKRDEM